MISDHVNVHRWTRKEYETAAYAGVFGDCRVELLDGVIYDKYPQTSMHAAGLRCVRRVLERICPEGYQVDVRLPLDLGSRSAPTPDLAIVLQDPSDYMDGHPSHAVLIVEVADGSLSKDLDLKETIYARVGIPELWISSLAQDRLWVYREPVRGSYQSKMAVSRVEQISPLACPDSWIAVDDILPRRR